VGTFERSYEGPQGRAVHPHTRGDIRQNARPLDCPYGSPPHAWGHLREPRDPGAVYRFTPTRVGTSPHRPPCVCRPQVHPHTRGDIQVCRVNDRGIDGSPPHAWGHLPHISPSRPRRRFTPTRVGTFGHASRAYVCPWVHPHTRGDIGTYRAEFEATYGSPPHAWGHFGTGPLRPVGMRFTPTRVGTFCTDLPSCPIQSVHPHTRGDINSSTGMSYVIFRFTPTRVGTFPASLRPPPPRSVHPHTRGDIRDSLLTAVCWCGSPPHAWGHCHDGHGVLLADRFTPTRVGTFSSSTFITVSAAGSPPHAWGHSLRPIKRLLDVRFTPTRVGTLGTPVTYSSHIAVHPHTRGDIICLRNESTRFSGSPPHAWGH